MVPLEAGAVALVPFPFSDLTANKVRPVVVLAAAGGEDWILCQVTSRPYGDPHAVAIAETHLAAGSLRLESFVRPGKLFTASSSLVVGTVDRLRSDRLAAVVDGLIRIVRGGA